MEEREDGGKGGLEMEDEKEKTEEIGLVIITRWAPEGHPVYRKNETTMALLRRSIEAERRLLRSPEIREMAFATNRSPRCGEIAQRPIFALLPKCKDQIA